MVAIVFVASFNTFFFTAQSKNNNSDINLEMIANEVDAGCESSQFGTTCKLL